MLPHEEIRRLPMGKNKFTGIWRLVAYETNQADGLVAYPYGKYAIGMIAYDRHGHMSVQIMRPDRPAFFSGDMRYGAPEEIRAAFDGYLAYFGNYEVNDKEGKVIHHITGSFFPGWVGQDRMFSFEFSGGRLTLKSLPVPQASTMVTWVWEREV